MTWLLSADALAAVEVLPVFQASRQMELGMSGGKDMSRDKEIFQ